MRKFLRDSCRALSAAALIAAIAGAPARAVDGNFSSADVLNGTTAAQDSCTGSAVWVVVEAKGDCIVFYAAGFQADNPKAVVFFQGDLISREWDRNGNTTWQTVEGDYDNDSPAKEQMVAQLWADRLGEPYLFLARPGTFGSSGDHKQRRRLREVQLVDAALSAIKQKYHIGSFVIVGQSSGGHLVGAMLAVRHDISCAVAASGVTAVRRRVELHGWPADATGFKDYWDPADHVGDIKQAPGLRILGVGDPDDRNVPFPAQTYWFDLLKKQGLDTTLFSGRALGSEHHGLANTGRIMAGMCARDLPTNEIEAAVGKMRS